MRKNFVLSAFFLVIALIRLTAVCRADAYAPIADTDPGDSWPTATPNLTGSTGDSFAISLPFGILSKIGVATGPAVQPLNWNLDDLNATDATEVNVTQIAGNASVFPTGAESVSSTSDFPQFIKPEDFELIDAPVQPLAVDTAAAADVAGLGGFGSGGGPPALIPLRYLIVVCGLAVLGLAAAIAMFLSQDQRISGSP